MTATYRDAVPDDAEALAALGRATFVETFGHLYTPENLAAFLESHSPERWHAELADPAYAVRIAEEEGRAAAYAKLAPPTLPFETQRRAAELRQFYVLKPWQGRGISTELMAWAIGEARRRGAEELYLSVFIDNQRARRFYARYGFEQVGTYDFMVGTHADLDLVMRLDLTPARHAGLDPASMNTEQASSREPVFMDPDFRQDDGSEVTIDVFKAGALAAVRHGFLGRRGGVSEGVCAGLNVGWGSDDDPEKVAENRRRAVEAVAPGARLVTVHQVHSGIALPATEPWPDDARPHADAVVTDRPGLVLGILTADCAPVLLADAEAGVVGAAHAGWKGAFSGVVEATVEAMERLGASRARIAAAVGPCIARRSYEVDEAFLRRFADAEAENERFFTSGREGHWQFDLEGFVVSRLAGAGLGRVEALGQDTYSQPDTFYSYRRSTHRSEPTYGRQIALVALRG